MFLQLNLFLVLVLLDVDVHPNRDGAPAIHPQGRGRAETIRVITRSSLLEDYLRLFYRFLFNFILIKLL